MNQTGLYWIWFSCLPFLRLRTRNELIDAFGGPEGVFHADEKKIATFRGMSSELASGGGEQPGQMTPWANDPRGGERPWSAPELDLD